MSDQLAPQLCEQLSRAHAPAPAMGDAKSSLWSQGLQVLLPASGPSELKEKLELLSLYTPQQILTEEFRMDRKPGLIGLVATFKKQQALGLFEIEVLRRCLGDANLEHDSNFFALDSEVFSADMCEFYVSELKSKLAPALPQYRLSLAIATAVQPARNVIDWRRGSYAQIRELKVPHKIGDLVVVPPALTSTERHFVFKILDRELLDFDDPDWERASAQQQTKELTYEERKKVGVKLTKSIKAAQLAVWSQLSSLPLLLFYPSLNPHDLAALKIALVGLHAHMIRAFHQNLKLEDLVSWGDEAILRLLQMQGGSDEKILAQVCDEFSTIKASVDSLRSQRDSLWWLWDTSVCAWSLFAGLNAPWICGASIAIHGGLDLKQNHEDYRRFQSSLLGVLQWSDPAFATNRMLELENEVSGSMWQMSLAVMGGGLVGKHLARPSTRAWQQTDNQKSTYFEALRRIFYRKKTPPPSEAAQSEVAQLNKLYSTASEITLFPLMSRQLAKWFREAKDESFWPKYILGIWPVTEFWDLASARIYRYYQHLRMTEAATDLTQKLKVIYPNAPVLATNDFRALIAQVGAESVYRDLRMDLLSARLPLADLKSQMEMRDQELEEYANVPWYRGLYNAFYFEVIDWLQLKARVQGVRTQLKERSIYSLNLWQTKVIDIGLQGPDDEGNFSFRRENFNLAGLETAVAATGFVGSDMAPDESYIQLGLSLGLKPESLPSAAIDVRIKARSLIDSYVLARGVTIMLLKMISEPDFVNQRIIWSPVSFWQSIGSFWVAVDESIPGDSRMALELASFADVMTQLHQAGPQFESIEHNGRVFNEKPSKTMIFRATEEMLHLWFQGRLRELYPHADQWWYWPHDVSGVALDIPQFSSHAEAHLLGPISFRLLLPDGRLKWTLPY